MGLVHRRAKLVVVLLLVAAGGALAYAGAAPEGYKGVADVVAAPAAFDGREVALKASVLEGSVQRDAEPLAFTIVDGAWSLPVRWDPAVPLPDREAGGTIEGKTVVILGTVVVEGGAPVLVAREMQVGCASKYQPE